MAEQNFDFGDMCHNKGLFWLGRPFVLGSASGCSICRMVVIIYLVKEASQAKGDRQIEYAPHNGYHGSIQIFLLQLRLQRAHARACSKRAHGLEFWQEPVELCSNNGFSARELTKIRNEIRANLVKIIEAWHEHCN
jgi:hypothetical protein